MKQLWWNRDTILSSFRFFGVYKRTTPLPKTVSLPHVAFHLFFWAPSLHLWGDFVYGWSLKKCCLKIGDFWPPPPYFVIFLLLVKSAIFDPTKLNLVKTHLCVVEKDYLWVKRIIFNDILWRLPSLPFLCLCSSWGFGVSSLGKWSFFK